MKNINYLKSIIRDSKAIARGIIYKPLFKKVGKNFRIGKRCHIAHYKGIEIGDNILIEDDCIIDGQGGVTIENDVLFAPRVSIYSLNHKYSNSEIPIKKQGLEFESIIIKSGSWLGVNSIILKGVTIGKNSVVGAGAVVTKNVPDYSVAVGVPAKVLRYL